MVEKRINDYFFDNLLKILYKTDSNIPFWNDLLVSALYILNPWIVSKKLLKG